jgi:hypothetical protein
MLNSIIQKIQVFETFTDIFNSNIPLLSLFFDRIKSASRQNLRRIIVDNGIKVV